MADFVAILSKTIDGLGDRNTVEMRQKVYERGKKAVADKIAAITPAPSKAQAERQFKLLDEAIAVVEAKYAPPPPPPVVEPIVAPEPEVKLPKLTMFTAKSDPLADFLASADKAEVEAAEPAAEVEHQSEDLPADYSPRQEEAYEEAYEPALSVDPVLGLDEHEPEAGPAQLSGLAGDAARVQAKNSRSSGLVFGLLGLLLIGGAGYAGYLYQDSIKASLGSSATQAPEPFSMKVDPAPEPEKIAEPTAPAEPAKPDNSPATPKLTQRLNADGTEMDEGPGAKPTDVGEGATVAAVTSPAPNAPGSSTAPDSASAAPAQTIAVGQKVIFYEEKTGTEQGTADQGAVVWSVVQDSPGLDQPLEPAIRGEINVPDKGIKIRLTMKRNVDRSLPASHIIEMLFTTPPDFAGGSVENVQRFAMKDTEQAPGNPLVGVPAAFGDGFFLIALTDEKSAIETNLALLSQQQWIDIPIAYGSGRRALVSFEKGLSGDKVFQEVIKSWQSKAVGGQ